MPTLHELPLAGYPEWGALNCGEKAYDERTGVELPTEKVKRARGREIDKMDEHNVKKDITWEEAKRLGLKIVKSRWVDGWKPLPDDPHGVRSRCVAQEVNTGPDHFWKLRCPKSVRHCGAKHICKSKCTKHTRFGPLLEVAMSKKCTPLWREALLEVTMFKTPGVRTTFGS